MDVQQDPPMVVPPTLVPVNNENEPEPPPPDCPATFVHVPIMIVPEIDLTICKPKIRVTNKGLCVPNCECQGCS